VLLLLQLLALPLAAAPQPEPETRDPQSHFFTQTFGDLPEEMETARSSGKQGMLLFFEQEGCPYCRRMMQTVFNQRKVQDWYESHLVSIAVDIRGDVELKDFDGITLPSKVFAAHRKVKYTPVLSFIDLHGVEVFRYSGMVDDPDEFLLMGQYFVEQRYFDTTYEDFLAEHGRHVADTVQKTRLIDH
jgi:thioredoxin-related protein